MCKVSYKYLDEDFLVLKEKVFGMKYYFGFIEMEIFVKWNLLVSLSYIKFLYIFFTLFL